MFIYTIQTLKKINFETFLTKIKNFIKLKIKKNEKIICFMLIF